MFWDKLARIINTLNEFIGKSIAWLTTALVALVCFDVIVRYIFSETQAWIMEVEWHLFALVFLLGAAYTFKHDKHVRVDLFYANFSDRDKAWVDLVGSVLFLIPWCVLVIYATSGYAYSSFLIRETSPDPGGLPALYPIKFAVVIGVALLLLQAIAKVIECIQVLQSTRQEP